MNLGCGEPHVGKLTVHPALFKREAGNLCNLLNIDEGTMRKLAPHVGISLDVMLQWYD